MCLAQSFFGLAIAINPGRVDFGVAIIAENVEKGFDVLKALDTDSSQGGACCLETKSHCSGCRHFFLLEGDMVVV